MTVTDDGPGVAPEDRERLFDRFYRVRTSREGQADGSGLGLAICREVALAHGGRTWVDSVPGSGAAFSLALPAAGPVRAAGRRGGVERRSVPRGAEQRAPHSGPR